MNLLPKVGGGAKGESDGLRANDPKEMEGEFGAAGGTGKASKPELAMAGGSEEEGIAGEGATPPRGAGANR